MSDTSVALRDFLDDWPDVPTIIINGDPLVEGMYSISEVDNNTGNTGKYHLTLNSPMEDGATGILDYVDSLMVHIRATLSLELPAGDLNFKQSNVTAILPFCSHNRTEIDINYTVTL